MIPAGYWDACRVNGKLYAVPTYKDSSMTNYFVWDKDLLDANGMDVTDLHTLESLHDTLAALKDKTSNAVLSPEQQRRRLSAEPLRRLLLRSAGAGRAL